MRGIRIQPETHDLCTTLFDLEAEVMALTEAGTESVRAEHDAVLGQLAAAAGWPADRRLDLRGQRAEHRPLPSNQDLVAMTLDENRDKASLLASIERAGAARRQARRSPAASGAAEPGCTHEPMAEASRLPPAPCVIFSGKRGGNGPHDAVHVSFWYVTHGQ